MSKKQIAFRKKREAEIMAEFFIMLDEAAKVLPSKFKNFDKTKNLQNQLQKLTRDLSPLLKLETLIDFSFKHFESNRIQRCDYIKYFADSMEKLWLGLFMNEHKRIWDGKRFHKIK